MFKSELPMVIGVIFSGASIGGLRVLVNAIANWYGGMNDELVIARNNKERKGRFAFFHYSFIPFLSSKLELLT